MAQLPNLPTLAPKDFRAYKLRLDMYKLRAEEYRKRYESMRSLEWKVLFQVYAGYAAIAVAFYRLIEGQRFDHSGVVAGLAISATAIFYLASRYLNYRIEERLINFNETYLSYLDVMQSSLEVDKQGPGTSALGGKYYWTYRVQLILSTLTLTGLLLYEAAAGFPAQFHFAATEISVVAALALLLGWLKVPTVPPVTARTESITTEKPLVANGC